MRRMIVLQLLFLAARENSSRLRMLHNPAGHSLGRCPFGGSTELLYEGVFVIDRAAK
jgi:hypothetical protein